MFAARWSAARVGLTGGGFASLKIERGSLDVQGKITGRGRKSKKSDCHAMS
jgi:hypothetical protein